MFSKKVLKHSFTALTLAALCSHSLFSADRQNSIIHKGQATSPDNSLMVHATSVAETHNGTVVITWYGGPSEGEETAVYTAYKTGNSWSSPQQVGQGPQGANSAWNPVLFQPSSGPLLLFYKFGGSPWGWSGRLLSSDDNGQSWENHGRMPNDAIGPTKNPPIEMPDGSLLLPSSTEKWGNHEGWEIHLEKFIPGNSYTDYSIQRIPSGSGFISGMNGCIQPTFLKLSADCQNLKMFTRGGKQATSNDGGMSWGNVGGMPNGAKSDPALCAVTCSNGYHIVARCASRRKDLRLSYSDNSTSWTDGVTIENDGDEADYPTVVEGSNQRLHVTWTDGGRGTGSYVGYALVDANVLTGGQATEVKSMSNSIEKASAFNYCAQTKSIEYRVEKDSQVKIDILNAQGQHINTPVNNIMASGLYSASLDNLSRGIYLVQILSDGYKKVERVNITY